MLAVDSWGAPALSPSDLPPGDVEMYLPGSIVGAVYASRRADGVREAGDQGIHGVRLDLLDAAGKAIAATETDAAGRYDFPALAPGVYELRQWQPAGFEEGRAWVGSGGGKSPAPNLVSEIVVMPGAELIGYDFSERAARSVVQVAAAPIVIPPTMAGMLPPAVEWPRRVEAVAPAPLAPPPAPSTVALAPLVQRSAEPIFGGSSSVPEEKEDVLLKSIESDELLAQDADAAAVDESAGEAAASELASDDARDRALELHGEAGSRDETAVAESTSTRGAVSGHRTGSARRVATKPAA